MLNVSDNALLAFNLADSRGACQIDRCRAFVICRGELKSPKGPARGYKPPRLDEWV